MNRKRLLKLAYAIEHQTLDKGFDMGGFSLKDAAMADTHCGTSGCIAGWACWLFAPDEKLGWADIQWMARKLLGLTHDQAEDLFFGYWADYDDGDYDGEITPSMAAKHLRELASEVQP